MCNMSVVAKVNASYMFDSTTHVCDAPQTVTLVAVTFNVFVFFPD